jgi:hypothetical protein
MPTIAHLIAHLALLLPAATMDALPNDEPMTAAGIEAQWSAASMPSGAPMMDSATEPGSFAGFIVDGLVDDTWNQVRIEQRMIIRIAPRLPGQFMAMPSRPQMEPRFVERKTAKCLPIASIAGVQPESAGRLLLITRNRKLMKFADIGLSDELLQSVLAAGYDEPTPIQAQAIPSVLMMRDLIGIAQTGTGKTASFVLPMIDILAHGRAPRADAALADPRADARTGRPGRRKLREVRQEPRSQDGAADRRRADGRSGQGAQRRRRRADRHARPPDGPVRARQDPAHRLRLLVIDEADRMLDMGFIPDIETICTKLPTTRQTLLFSATMPPPIKKLADKFLSNPKMRIEVARAARRYQHQHRPAQGARAHSRNKRDVLRHLLRADNVTTAIIFCNRKTTVRELATRACQSHGFRRGEIHGDMDQSARIAELTVQGRHDQHPRARQTLPRAG